MDAAIVEFDALADAVGAPPRMTTLSRALGSDSHSAAPAPSPSYVEYM